MTAIERVFTFGPNLGLVGILTEPEADLRCPDAPTFVMWNVGLNHRVGPFRFFVQLSRALAEAGFSSLRFDVSGLGDSEVSRDDRRRDAERAEGDVCSAMQALREKTGADKFVLIGFCSGVDAAHALARSEEQVTGAVFLEGYAFETRGFWMRYPKRFIDRNRWERFFRLRFPHLFGEPADWSQAVSEQELVYVRDYPTPERFGREVRQIAQKRTHALFVYVGGDSTYTYRDQLFESTGRGDFEKFIDLEFYDDADHTFFLSDHRQRTLARIVDWAKTYFLRRSSRDHLRSGVRANVSERKAG